MDTCFIIQPFDRGEFDKRCDDIFIPAIENAGLIPYRVDRDPSATVLMDEIINRIANARICLADISLDNPNVWLEVGMAIMNRKNFILICSEERQKFPFDVQHRHIITYKKESLSDFRQLEKIITEKLKALMTKEDEIQKLSKISVEKIQGLESHEIAALATIFKNRSGSEDGVDYSTIHDDMERGGYTKVATNLALTRLSELNMINVSSGIGDYNIKYYLHFITNKGEKWLLNNQSLLILRQTEKDVSQLQVSHNIP